MSVIATTNSLLAIVSVKMAQIKNKMDIKFNENVQIVLHKRLIIVDKMLTARSPEPKKE